MVIMSRAGARFWLKKELPKHVIYLYNDGRNHWPGIKREWKEYTRAELNAEKKEKQESRINEKTYHCRTVPGYIHVFRVNTGFLFDGFYIGIQTNHGFWYLNWKTETKHEKFLPMIKQRFRFSLLDDDDYIWCEHFCKAYPINPKGIQNPRGNYPVNCVLDSYNQLIDIDFNRTRSKAGDVL